MKFRALLPAAFLCTIFPGWAQEKPFSDVNAYNPVPSPDGKYVAFVKTGLDRRRGSGGFGRSNLSSEVQIAQANGAVVGYVPIDGFLGEWLADNSAVICYRDHTFGLASQLGWQDEETMPSPASPGFLPAERVTYVAPLRKFVWLERQGSETLLQTPQGPIGRIDSRLPTGDLIVPSPDGRYLAIAGTSAGYGFHLVVYDIREKTTADLGEVTVHPDANWDYIKPSWNPWFADNSRLAYVSKNALYTAWPDGTHKVKIAAVANAGLPVPSPEGDRIAFVTFTPRPMKLRPDLKFWGDATMWMVPSGGGTPVRVTEPSEDTTYDLRWLNRYTLIFDRIGDTAFYSQARIWTVEVRK